MSPNVPIVYRTYQIKKIKQSRVTSPTLLQVKI